MEFVTYCKSDVDVLCPQGLMFGYATDETEECMPLTVVLSHQLNARIAQLRRSGELKWARPDTKTQVRKPRHTRTIIYFNKKSIFPCHLI